MLTLTQRDKVRDALEKRASLVSKVNARKLRRVANESRVFDRFLDRKTKAIKREKPNASDGEILKILLDWITNGGLDQILAFIKQILDLFV
ncbi:MAG: hypothetical protein JNL96_21175 [Planctomycetaceae bacterium]|nr:hypothetical protein [Planctomycetaceae bacterium]